MTCRALTVLAVALPLLTACGARTTIARGDDDPGAGGSGAGGDSATGGGAATGGGHAGCTPETFGGPDTAGAQRIEVDATHAYWTTVDGRLMRAAFGGGEPELLLAGLVDAGDLALDGDRVVVASGGSLLAVPRAGGAAIPLVEEVASVVQLAADASGIYWMAGGDGIFAYALERLAPDGTRSTLVAPLDFGLGLALTPTHAVFTGQGLGDPEALDVVARVPKAGGAVEVLASRRNDPTNVFVRGDDLFWTEQLDVTGGPAGVVRLSAGSAEPERILAAPAGALPLLGAATSSTVVLTALGESGGLLLAAPIDGGEVVVLAEGRGLFLEPAASGDRVAFTVQPVVDDPDATSDVKVRVLCP